MPNLPNKKDCTGCMACVDSCKHDAISIVYENGHMYIDVDNNKCVDCKLCEKNCPVKSTKRINERDFLEVKGGWCKDADTRKHSASGGAFSAIALSVLKRGGYAVGASLNEDDTVEHIIIHSVEDLPKLQNSKYIQSKTKDIYKRTKALLKSGNLVVFSGTPCQTAAIHRFLGKQYENLITVDVICNGIPSHDAINAFSEQNNVRKIISFRNKRFGWNNINSQYVEYASNSKEKTNAFESRDIFYKIFSCGLTHRNSCCNCKFSTIPRFADITLADFWGIKRFEDEWDDGISLIVANNPKGLHFLESCNDLHMFDSNLEEAIDANPRLVNGRKFHNWHLVMIWRAQVRSFFGEKAYLKIISNEMPYKLLWGALKVLTIISNKLKVKKELYYDKKYRNHNNL